MYDDQYKYADRTSMEQLYEIARDQAVTEQNGFFSFPLTCDFEHESLLEQLPHGRTMNEAGIQGHEGTAIFEKLASSSPEALVIASILSDEMVRRMEISQQWELYLRIARSESTDLNLRIMDRLLQNFAEQDEIYDLNRVETAKALARIQLDLGLNFRAGF